MDTESMLQVLDARRSVPSKQLAEPGPDHVTLHRMLASAVRVPDHGKLVPFRFIHIHGDARHALGDQLAARTRALDPDAPDAAVEKDRGRFSSAPDIITVVARLTPGHKVPEQEQLLTAGSVCFALLQAAQAFGFGAQWLTGWMAYDAQVAQSLGLAPGEKIVGFIHIGTPRLEAPERERPDPATLLTEWMPDA
ncbi:nitroreductase [Pseudoxanthomonas sp.]|uniref:nitroreductase family protein n=1 Tax=Pseudoxanthomonas sp. TaxID=1871049 RepID=UPI002FE2B758